MSDRLPIHALDTTGADSTNDTPRYNSVTGRLEYAPGGGSSSTIREALTASSTGSYTLTLGATPISGTPMVWLNGVILWPGIGYTIAGVDIAFTASLTAGDDVWLSYQTSDPAPAASTLTTTTVNYDTVLLSKNPSAYFTFSEASTASWVDASGNSKTVSVSAGTPVASSTGGPTLTGGLTSGKVTFNGASRLVTDLVPSNFTNFSLCGWIKTTSTAYTNVMSCRPTTSPQGVAVYMGGAPVNGGAAGTLAYGQTGDGAWSGRKTAETVNGGTWRWFMATWGSVPMTYNPTSGWKIYLDGVLATMSDSYYGGNNSPVAGGGPWYIGGHPTDGGTPLTGELSRMAYFNGVELTATDAADIYAAASA